MPRPSPGRALAPTRARSRSLTDGRPAGFTTQLTTRGARSKCPTWTNLGQAQGSGEGAVSRTRCPTDDGFASRRGIPAKVRGRVQDILALYSL